MVNDQAFIKAYDEHADAIFRYIYLRLYDREIAFDLMQETFIRTWKYLAKGTEIEFLKPLLYKIAHNLIIDHIRKAKPVASLDQLLEHGFEPKAEEPSLSNQLDAASVLKVIDRLKPKFREVILLRYVEEFQPKEIAQMLGIRENLVSVRINRALQDLRNLIHHE